MTHDPSVALAADYSDALITARRAKNVLLLLVALMLIGQISLFCVAKFTKAIPVQNPPASIGSVVNAAAADVATAMPTTLPDMSASAAANNGTLSPKLVEVLQYAVGLTGFLGITLSIVLSVVLLLLTMIMLVGRLLGVSRVTSALIWSIVLIVLLFPWQAFLADAHFASDFKIPGVLYTWAELVRFAKVGVDGDKPSLEVLILHWGRFVAFPLLTLIITLMIQMKSNRGLREALGEVDSIANSPVI